MWSHVAPPAIRPKPFFSLDPHGVFIKNAGSVSTMTCSCCCGMACAAYQRFRLLTLRGSRGAWRLLSPLRDGPKARPHHHRT
jgi:hypothetical protein